MKTFDVDAKQLIRNYIDSIEEFVRNHTRLHPNEIDGLLNEINDFVYLRSRELTVGDRVRYSDVLRAIEECGSPSEISEQYLDMDQIESRDDAIAERTVFKPQSGLEEAKIEKGKVNEGSSSAPASISRSPLPFSGNTYRNARGFGVYRAFFIAFISLQLFGFITYLPIDHYYYNVNYYSNDIIPAFAFSSLGYDLCLALTIYTGILILLECWLINRWKAKLVVEGRIDRRTDDILVTWLSRISFLVIFLKTSFLFIPAYIVFTPIWFILALIVERSLQSELWEEKLSSRVVKFGHFLTNNEELGIHFNEIQRNFRMKHSKDELGVALIPFVLLLLSFFFVPFIAFSTWGVFALFSIGGMALILILIIYFRGKYSGLSEISRSQVYFGESDLIVWLVRLLALKTLFSVIVLYHLDTLFLQFLVIMLWIAIEIASNSLGGESTRSWLGNFLVRIGSSETIQVKQPIQEERILPSQDHSLPVVPTRIEPSVQEQPVVSTINQVEYTSLSQPQVIEKTIEVPRKQSSWLFRITGALIKAIAMSFSMLIITIFEVILIFAILFTNFTDDGTYLLPNLHFDLTWISPAYSDVVIPDYTVYVWYALFMLTIQIFLVVLLEYYGIATRSSEGVVVRLGRNLSRFMIFILFIGAVVRFSFYNNYYAMLELMVLSIFFIFNEVNAWKVRSERKKWLKNEEMNQFGTKSNEKLSPPQLRIS
ncbi:MAG: hypothetical protein ACXACU_01270 [Candidatus Hodarchaeales archaeon]|jgi:hypothetical protein